MIRGEIYKQTYGKVTDFTSSEIIEFGEISCRDCEGAGNFEIEDSIYQECNVCKGTGFEYVSMY